MVVKVAMTLGVDPMRLAANAGRLPLELHDQHQPLPVPELREPEQVRQQVMARKGVSAEAKRHILEIYESDIAKEGSGDGESPRP
ncbi:hypothetical protein ACGFJT_37520 [Actinomadura geliboluensis]|uniref:hypothetical protein n=1 Tax=Actinomadura geliboluensis TaxID=882440 RepID=UPI003722FF07